MLNRDPLNAIIQAARRYADTRLQEAAERRLSRAPVFVAFIAIEAAHAYLKLWGPRQNDEADQPASVPETVIIKKPVPVEHTQGMDHYRSCKWGPN